MAFRFLLTQTLPVMPWLHFHRKMDDLAYMSFILTACERPTLRLKKWPQKAVRPWSHFLKGRRFTLVTDQEAESFMFDQGHRGKIKNAKILGWRLELSHMTYDICHKPGSENIAVYASSRVCDLSFLTPLQKLHHSLCHPGYARLYHFVPQRYLLCPILVKRRGKSQLQDICRGETFLQAALADTRGSCTSLGSPKLRFQRTWYRSQTVSSHSYWRILEFTFCLSVKTASSFTVVERLCVCSAVYVFWALFTATKMLHSSA